MAGSMVQSERLRSTRTGAVSIHLPLQIRCLVFVPEDVVRAARVT